MPLLRWPGGCFADTYHWRDGIGAQDKRPRNVDGDSVDEINAVGTHEFFDLIDMLGADAYVNVGTGSVQEMSDWVEYMTADGGSPLARLRAQNGHAKPFKVAYFGIGNELWGCGGNMKLTAIAPRRSELDRQRLSRSGHRSGGAGRLNRAGRIASNRT